jgi:hypothetical protein
MRISNIEQGISNVEGAENIDLDARSGAGKATSSFGVPCSIFDILFGREKAASLELNKISPSHQGRGV